MNQNFSDAALNVEHNFHFGQAERSNIFDRKNLFDFRTFSRNQCLEFEVSLLANVLEELTLFRKILKLHLNLDGSVKIKACSTREKILPLSLVKLPVTVAKSSNYLDTLVNITLIGEPRSIIACSL